MKICEGSGEQNVGYLWSRIVNISLVYIDKCVAFSPDS